MFHRLQHLALLGAIGSVIAQTPAGQSICDYYTKALFGTNSAVLQYGLLTLLVNTAVIGNYTQVTISNVHSVQRRLLTHF